MVSVAKASFRLSGWASAPNKGRPAYLRRGSGLRLTSVFMLRRIDQMTRRRLPVVALLALVLAAPAGAGSPPLAKRLARALAVPHVARGQTAAIAFDLQTGKTLFSEHEALSPVRRRAVVKVDDLAVGAADAHLAHTYENIMLGAKDRPLDVYDLELPLLGKHR